jgi:hypothetical protein
MIASHALHLTVVALIRSGGTGTSAAIFFRSAENSSQCVAGNIISIVHTARAFNPTAQQAAPQRAA